MRLAAPLEAGYVMNGNLWAKVAFSHVLAVCTVRLMAGLAGNAVGREGHFWDLSHEKEIDVIRFLGRHEALKERIKSF